MKLRDKPTLVSVVADGRGAFNVTFDCDVLVKYVDKGAKTAILKQGHEGKVYKEEAPDELAVAKLINNLILKGRLIKHG